MKKKIIGESRKEKKKNALYAELYLFLDIQKNIKHVLKNAFQKLVGLMQKKDGETPKALGNAVVPQQVRKAFGLLMGI